MGPKFRDRAAGGQVLPRRDVHVDADVSSCPDDDNDSSRGGDETVASHAEAAARPRLAAYISSRRSVHRPERVKETFGLTSCTIADCLALEDVTTALGTGALRDHERGRILEVEPPEAQSCQSGMSSPMSRRRQFALRRRRRRGRLSDRGRSASEVSRLEY